MRSYVNIDIATRRNVAYINVCVYFSEGNWIQMEDEQCALHFFGWPGRGVSRNLCYRLLAVGFSIARRDVRGRGIPCETLVWVWARTYSRILQGGGDLHIAFTTFLHFSSSFFFLYARCMFFSNFLTPELAQDTDTVPWPMTESSDFFF